MPGPGTRSIRPKPSAGPDPVIVVLAGVGDLHPEQLSVEGGQGGRVVAFDGEHGQSCRHGPRVLGAPHRSIGQRRQISTLAAEAGQGEARLLVTGAATPHFERKLDGRGRTVALAFRPAGFRPFVACPASELVDATVPLGQLLAASDAWIASHLLDSDVDVEDAGRELRCWFRSLAPEPDPMVDELASLVDAAECDRPSDAPSSSPSWLACPRTLSAGSASTSAPARSGWCSAVAFSMWRAQPIQARTSTGPPWLPSSAPPTSHTSSATSDPSWAGRRVATRSNNATADETSTVRVDRVGM